MSSSREVEAEVQPAPSSSDDALPTIRPLMSTVPTYEPSNQRLFQTLLAVITKLWGSPSASQLDRFLRSRPEPTSMPFLMWLADQEAAATGGDKARLAALCETLVVMRERLDRERMEDLYAATLDLLAGEEPAAVAEEVGGGTAAVRGDEGGVQPPSSISSTNRSSDSSSSDEGQGESAGAGTSAEAESEARRAATSLRQQLGGTAMEATNNRPGAPASEEGSTDRVGHGEFGGPAQAGSSQTRSVGQEAELAEQLSGATAAALQLQQRRRSEAVALLSSSPELYSAMLAERLTGAPAVVDGYGPVYDLLLKAAPPAALTEQGIKQAHAEAELLAVDMRQRRKRSVASLIGRARLTAEQADVLKAGTPACRILDMLLTLPSHEERVTCLPDCFTPPDTAAAAQAAAAAQQQQGGQGSNGALREEEEEELWCTPSQLLSEVEVRLRSVLGAGTPGGAAAAGPAPRALPGKPELTGPALLDCLQQLKQSIMLRWHDDMQSRL